MHGHCVRKNVRVCVFVLIFAVELSKIIKEIVAFIQAGLNNINSQSAVTLLHTHDIQKVCANKTNYEIYTHHRTKYNEQGR